MAANPEARRRRAATRCRRGRSVCADHAASSAGSALRRLDARAWACSGFITGDFALNWQPVPAGVPGRTALAYLTAALSWALGAGLLFDRFKHYVRHRDRRSVSRVGGAPAWTGGRRQSAERPALARLHRASGRSRPAHSCWPPRKWPGTPFARWAMPVGEDFVRCVSADLRPVALGVCAVHGRHDSGLHPRALVLGVLHRLQVHFAAGVAILTGVLARAGAVLFAVMVSGFVLLLHVPRVHRRARQPRRMDDDRDRDDDCRRCMVHGWKPCSQGRQAGLIHPHSRYASHRGSDLPVC